MGLIIISGISLRLLVLTLHADLYVSLSMSGLGLRLELGSGLGLRLQIGSGLGKRKKDW